MLENREVEVELYPMNKFEQNKMSGGELNTNFFYLNKGIIAQYNDKLNELYKSIQGRDDIYTIEYRQCMDSLSLDDLPQDEQTKLYRRIDQLRTEDKQYNDEGKSIVKQIMDVRKVVEDNVIESIKQNPDEASLAKLYMLISDNSFQPDLEKNQQYSDMFYNYFATKFASNPMSLKIIENFDALKIKEGCDFIDFEAPDLDGNVYKLSELIKGKVVVLDLWASWCAPCMRTSKSFIPVWEKYKNRGFEIIGVAREGEDTKAMKAAIQRLGLEWLNLVEQNDKAKIWVKYGAGNAGGRVILIDSNGKIVDMDFTAEELENHLEKLIL